MTAAHDPHADPQHRASDPAVSVFVTANAGSGKTTTLVNRVARLLLGRALPEAILCITYTKAAASEMQRRLFLQLGAWSTMADDDLRRELSRIEGRAEDSYGEERLRDARMLFARALETPGGLKIQTIHAFCEKLLRRFPLEAGVSPSFQVMDDGVAAEIVAEARAQVARLAMSGAGRVGEAYARLSVALDFEGFHKMFAAFEAERAAIADYVSQAGARGGVEADVWNRCGFDRPETPDEVEADAMRFVDRDLWREVAGRLTATGGVNDGKNAAALRAAIGPDGDFDKVLAALFTERGQGTPATWVAKSKAFGNREDLRSGLLDQQSALEDARARRRASRIAGDTLAALVLAQAYVDAYRIEKDYRGALDFADLVLKTDALLTQRADAAWVLYKLDGGIDHLLLDEAQDTAPEQWRIVRSLTSEFFVGAGLPVLRALERTLFVVGDQKQSIYSFQGAAPHLLAEERDAHLAVMQAAGRPGQVIPLTKSYRSTPQVLAFVDGLFADPGEWAGVVAAGETLEHQAHRINDSGCVEIWPLVREETGDARSAWDAPLDEAGPRGANKVIAARIAAEIKALVARGDAVGDHGDLRPAGFGDVLILVRRRGVLFEEIIRALKQADVPFAGADRLSLSDHIAFDDLVALGRFVQFPQDDLNLAALLRSPLFDMGEDDLFALAYGRNGARLWPLLQARAEERPQWSEATERLNEALREGRRRRPFDFFARFLSMTDRAGRSMRSRILTRLGAEAEDVLDAFLAQAGAAEGAGVHDMERLLHALSGIDITVKRELEGPRGEVRVMTVHGAKGLEAPIVFMPETTVARSARSSPLMRTEDGGYLWCASAKDDFEGSKEARAWRARREAEETQRLLYVGLTRARDRLILTGRIAANAKRDAPRDWYAAAEAALVREGLADQVSDSMLGDMQIRRFGPAPATLPPRLAVAAAPAALPGWARQAAPAESAVRLRSPSALAEADHGPAPSPLSEVGGLGRFRRGELIHRLLQLLPDLPHAERPEAAVRLLAREAGLSDAQRAEMAAAALGVLQDDRFSAVFGPGSRAEAAIAGAAADLPPGMAISGRVDRLLVEQDRVLVVDFKTNRPSPDVIERADPAYLDQMAVYVAVLREVFPGRRVEAALVWTDGPKLMPVGENMVAQRLHLLRGGVAGPGA